MKKDVSITCPNCGAALFKNEQCAYCSYDVNEDTIDLQDDEDSSDVEVVLLNSVSGNKSCHCPRCKIKLWIPSELEDKSFLMCRTCGRNFHNPVKHPHGETIRVFTFILVIILAIFNIIVWSNNAGYE
jgi:uncharacterized paraquat-inducible protein A